MASSRYLAELTAEELGRRAAGRTAPLKSFLLNQAHLAGVGNIYADEALFRAELHPLSPAGSMKPKHLEALRDGIVGALEAGLENGGSSIDDYRNARGEPGTMQDEFLVHTREGKECVRCGETIRRIVVAGRSTYFCPGCQHRLRRRPRRRRKVPRKVSAVAPPPGFLIGHYTDSEGVTGCTAIVAPPGSRGGVDVRGGAPGTRETDAVGVFSRTDEVTAVVLSGGSAFGLAAADGAVRWCEEQGRGFPTAPAGPVPIVAAAIIFDLAVGRAAARPGPDAGYAACGAAAAGIPAVGAVGAGTGATVGKILGMERCARAGVGYAATSTGLGRRLRPSRLRTPSVT